MMGLTPFFPKGDRIGAVMRRSYFASCCNFVIAMKGKTNDEMFLNVFKKKKLGKYHQLFISLSAGNVK